MTSQKIDPVVVSLATIPRRTASLRRVIQSLLPQADRINVYLNGHRSVPGFLFDAKIHVELSSRKGDNGDAGKFWWSNKLGAPSYHLTVDDDLLYPPDYCRTIVAKIEEFGRRAVVGFHGVVLSEAVRGKYYGDRRVYPCLGNLVYDTAVHILGTGALGYHTSTLKVRPRDFRRANMADIWFGILAKRQATPMICINHSGRWLVDLGDPDPTKCIAATHPKHNGIQASALRAVNPWPSPLTVSGVARGVPKRRATRNVVGLHAVRVNVGIRMAPGVERTGATSVHETHASINHANTGQVRVEIPSARAQPTFSQSKTMQQRVDERLGRRKT